MKSLHATAFCLCALVVGCGGSKPLLIVGGDNDGAGAITRFVRITLPLLSPVILFNAINAVNGALQIFTPGYILPLVPGGPNNGSLFYMLNLYQNAFSYAQLGYASAMAVILFIVGIVLAFLIFRLSRRYVHYGVEA